MKTSAANGDDGRRLGRLLFTFGLVTDGHVKPEEGDLSSPWAVNLLANGRNRYVVREINGLDPDFVVNMGDLVHPVPVLPTYGSAVDAFNNIYATLNCPLHLIPGNHDVGDKPVAWMPAGLVDQDGVNQFRHHFGADYSSFDHGDCHFVLLDNVVCNSGIAAETEQAAWLEKDLAGNVGKRTFLFMHYPLYLIQADEPPSYDNVDEPARSWLLSLIERHRIEAVFAGHVHNFSYNRHGATECYTLPSITFYRHDHGDVFKAAPLPETEDGRNDVSKLGFFLVKVYEDGHAAHMVRTWGATLEADAPDTPARRRLSMRQPRETGPTSLGVHLRHPWAEVTELPYSGPLDEFARKRVRNDYSLAAIWEAGVGKLRVPFSDLAEAATRRHMAWLKDLEHAFTVFTFGPPDRRVATVLGRYRHLVDTWEVVLSWPQAAAAAAAIRRIRRRTGLKVFLNRLETSAHEARRGSKFSHFVSHGFATDGGDAIASFFGAHDGVADGAVFRATMDETPSEAAAAVGRIAHGLGITAALTVRLALDDPAAGNRDDNAIAARVAEAGVVALTHPHMDVFLDTFVDVDRGYFVRHGLVDRRYNPRPAGRVLGHLNAAMADAAGGLRLAGTRSTPAGRLLSMEAGEARYHLLLPDTPPGKAAPGEECTAGGTWIDLVSGEATTSVGPGPALLVPGA